MCGSKPPTPSLNKANTMTTMITMVLKRKRKNHWDKRVKEFSFAALENCRKKRQTVGKFVYMTHMGEGGVRVRGKAKVEKVDLIRKFSIFSKIRLTNLHHFPNPSPHLFIFHFIYVFYILNHS